MLHFISVVLAAYPPCGNGTKAATALGIDRESLTCPGAFTVIILTSGQEAILS
jgi:hypothetical protein